MREQDWWTDLSVMPVADWQQVLQSDNLQYLVRPARRSTYARAWERHREDAARLWQRLQHDFIGRFGFTQRMMLIERKKLALERLMLDAIISGDKTLDDVIEIRRRELEKMISAPQGEPQAFEEQVVILETHFKLPIDTERVSVLKYYSYIRLYEQEVEQQKKMMHGRKR